MTCRPIATWLQRFDAPLADRGDERIDTGQTEAWRPVFQMPDDARVADGIAETDRNQTELEAIRAEERQRWQIELELMRISERQSAAKLVEAERCRWDAVELPKLRNEVDAGLAAIERRVTDSVARLLALFMADDVRARALNEFVVVVSETLRRSGSRLLELRGPSDRLTAVRLALPKIADEVRFVVDEGEELSAVTDHDEFIETNFAAWARRIARALEE